jgi:hypothetical protein
MGYTHYWRNTGKIDTEAYANAYADALRIAQHGRANKVLGDCQGLKGSVYSMDGIGFNGMADAGQDHETFFIPLDPARLSDFECCKTAGKAYDKYVTAILATLANNTGLVISSDGRREEWIEGCELASKILGQTVPNPITSAKQEIEADVKPAKVTVVAEAKPKQSSYTREAMLANLAKARASKKAVPKAAVVFAERPKQIPAPKAETIVLPNVAVKAPEVLKAVVAPIESLAAIGWQEVAQGTTRLKVPGGWLYQVVGNGEIKLQFVAGV